MKKPHALKIAELGRPVLRQRAKPVKNFDDPQLQELIDNMVATCKAANGVGIAAPQVFESLRVFIVWSHPTARYPKARTAKPETVINPKIIERSKVTTKDWEGCLSIPGIRAQVPRYTWIRASYTNRKGQAISKRFSGFAARIFQHELDHINGVVFLDRVRSRDIITEKEYGRLTAV
jgi:peptide deformylase